MANLLISKKIAGAGLDVFENEPQISPKLFEAENVVLLPHISSATIESRLEMGNRVIKNITDFFNMKKPQDTIWFILDSTNFTILIFRNPDFFIFIRNRVEYMKKIKNIFWISKNYI